MRICNFCAARVQDAERGSGKQCPVCSVGTITSISAAAARDTPHTVIAPQHSFPKLLWRVRIGHEEKIPPPTAPCFFKYFGEDSTDALMMQGGMWLQFWVPSAFGPPDSQLFPGFRLRLELSSNECRLRYHGPAKALGSPPSITDSRVTLDLPENSHGWYYVQLQDAVNPTVQVKLIESGYARETEAPNAPPLIPWNFFYWSHSWGGYHAFAKEDDRREVERCTNKEFFPLDKYARAFSADGQGQALAWERNPTNGHCIERGQTGYENHWQGHCDGAAAASVALTVPETGYSKTRSGERPIFFAPDELKFLASEWAQDWVGGRRHWTLPADLRNLHPSEYAHTRKVEALAPVDRRKVIYAPTNIRTEREVLSKEIIDVQGAPINGWYRDNEGKKFPASVIKPHWKEKSYAEVRQRLGVFAAQFFGVLREKIARKGHALLSDFRTAFEQPTLLLICPGSDDRPCGARFKKSDGTVCHNCGRAADGSETETRDKVAQSGEVWNQAIFFYEAEFKENPVAEVRFVNASDETELIDRLYPNARRCAQDILMTVTIVANDDTTPPTKHPPAERSSDGNGIALKMFNRTRRLLYRLQFDDHGALARDPANAWLDCSHGDKKYYIPSNLDTVEGLAAAPSGKGNPHVIAERLKTLGIQVRPRYARVMEGRANARTA